MKYLRLIIALIAGGLFWCFSGFILDFIKIVDISKPLLENRLLIYIGIISMFPFAAMVSKTWKNPLLKIEGVKENALLLECEYTFEKDLDIESNIKFMKTIMNSQMYFKNELLLMNEDSSSLEYYLTDKNNSRIAKENDRMIGLNAANITVCFIKVSENRAKITIQVVSDRILSLNENSDNRMILNCIIYDIKGNITIAST